ncbi:MAG: hypothetical protein R3250_07085 [Melioribacteraceae bacterium]|nr:hypothetical protein [Melioribacteraceae bacterium]
MKESNPMDKFNFLLGRWKMESNIPKSKFSDAYSGNGTGEFKRILNNKYVTFDYSFDYSKGKGSAHALFVWDNKSNIYRYWWFENSGEHNEATCDFIDENTLCLNWHNSLFVQSFKKINSNNILLEMRYPADKNDYVTVLTVIFRK